MACFLIHKRMLGLKNVWGVNHSKTGFFPNASFFASFRQLFQASSDVLILYSLFEFS